MNKVNVKYNPYLPELTVLINNKPLSKYSSIMSYKHKSFIEWCSRFFDRINSEVNDKYDLQFTATEFENEIFETLAAKSTNCNHYTFCPIKNNRDVISRLQDLHKLGDNGEPTEVKVGIWAEDKIFIQGVMELMVETDEYTEIDTSNLISRHIPLVRVHVSKTEFAEELLEKDIAIVLMQGELRSESLSHLQRLGKNVFLINLTDKACFSGKKLNVFNYHVIGDDVVTCIERIIEGVALPQVLSDREYELEKRFSYNGISISPNSMEKLELICATDRIYRLSFPSKTFVGRTSDASIKVIPNINIDLRCSLISQNGLLSINGFSVEAMKSGEDILELYCDDNPLPVASCEVNISDESFIREIRFEGNAYNVAIGDTAVLNYSFYPENAVNESELEWVIDDLEICSFGNDGIKGQSPGSTAVALRTQESSASVTVNVLPHVEQIELTNNHIVITEGEKKQWMYKLLPNKRFGEEIECFEKGSERISSSNERVAIYKGGYIEGKIAGDATIFVTIPGSELRGLCHVTVKKKGLF